MDNVNDGIIGFGDVMKLHGSRKRDPRSGPLRQIGQRAEMSIPRYTIYPALLNWPPPRSKGADH